MRIKKTATELKQDALMRNYKQRHVKNQKRKKAKKKPLPYESVNYLKTLSYRDFLLSKYWKLVRSKILARDKNACVICQSTVNLHVHHDTYKHHFNELNNLGDLITLCAVCHREHHYAQD